MLFYGKRVSARFRDFQYGAAVFDSLVLESRPAYFGTELKRNAHGAVESAERTYSISILPLTVSQPTDSESNNACGAISYDSYPADVGDMPPKYSDIIISGPHDQP